MVSLIPTPPLPVPPIFLGACQLATVDLGPLASFAPKKGQESALQAYLATLDLACPPPNHAQSNSTQSVLWAGAAQWFFQGSLPEKLMQFAYVSDQSDGWATLSLSGATAPNVLARLYPLDLREKVFGVGQLARAPLMHMASLLHRTKPREFTLYVFRSMAQTAWHEVKTAMIHVAARGRDGV